MRARNVRHGHPRDRRIEIEESLIRDHRRDLGPEAARAQVLVHDQAAAGPADAVSTASRSQGYRVRRSITSALSSSPPPLRARHHRPQVTMVIASPSRVFLRPPERQHIIHRRARAAAPGSSSMARCSKNSTGSLPRNAPRSRPTASSALDGTATCQPGLCTNCTSLVRLCHGSPHLRGSRPAPAIPSAPPSGWWFASAWCRYR